VTKCAGKAPLLGAQESHSASVARDLHCLGPTPGPYVRSATLHARAHEGVVARERRSKSAPSNFFVARPEVGR
jgi:hypothetical protein